MNHSSHGTNKTLCTATEKSSPWVLIAVYISINGLGAVDGDRVAVTGPDKSLVRHVQLNQDAVVRALRRIGHRRNKPGKGESN